MKTIVFVSVELAKRVFAVHEINPVASPELIRPYVPRVRLHELIDPP